MATPKPIAETACTYGHEHSFGGCTCPQFKAQRGKPELCTCTHGEEHHGPASMRTKPIATVHDHGGGVRRVELDVGALALGLVRLGTFVLDELAKRPTTSAPATPIQEHIRQSHVREAPSPAREPRAAIAPPFWRLPEPNVIEPGIPPTHLTITTTEDVKHLLDHAIAKSDEDVKLGKGELAIVGALRAYHPKPLSWRQLAVLTLYHPKGGRFVKLVSTCRSHDLLHGGQGKLLFLTSHGRTIEGTRPPAMGKALRDAWLAQLGVGEQKLITALALAHPRPLTKDELARSSDYEADGGRFVKLVSIVVGYGLALREAGGIVLCPELAEEGSRP